MKKILLLVALVSCIVIITTMSLAGCKVTTETTVTAAAETTAAETTAAETTAAAETTVAETDTIKVDYKTLSPDNLPAGWKIPKTIGHITNFLIHEWYQNETKGEKKRSEDFGIEFSTNDANLDLQKSLAAIDDYVSKKIDVIIFTPVNEKASGPALLNASAKGAVIVGEASPADGMLTVVSTDDYAAGKKLGKYAGEYILENYKGVPVKVLSIDLPALSTTVARASGFHDGLIASVPDAKFVSVDGKGVKDEAVKVAADALTANPDVNVIFGINDDSTVGGLQAYRAGGFEKDKLIGGFSVDFAGSLGQESLLGDIGYKAAAAMFPEYTGWLLIQTAIMAYNNYPLPKHTLGPTMVMTKEIFNDWYDKVGDKWVPKLDKVMQISTEGEV